MGRHYTRCCRACSTRLYLVTLLGVIYLALMVILQTSMDDSMWITNNFHASMNANYSIGYKKHSVPYSQLPTHVQPTDQYLNETNGIEGKEIVLQTSSQNINTVTAIPILEPELHSNCDDMELETLQHLIHDVFIYSGYWDSRPNDFDNKLNMSYARIMAIIPNTLQIQLACEFVDDKSAHIVDASPYLLNEHHSKFYRGYILSCLVPANYEGRPCALKLYLKSDSNVRVIVPMRDTRATSQMHDFGVCTSPLFGMIDPVYLIEFIELCFLLGASHITLYDSFVGPQEIKHILRYYVEQKMVEVVAWPLPNKVVEKIWYRGQTIAIQDCLYRNMGKVNILAFNDLDEFIVPMTHETWKPFIHEHSNPKYCGYSFESAFITPVPKHPGSSILLTCRSQHRTMLFNKQRTKNFVVPHLIFEKGIHHVSKPIWAHLEVENVNSRDAFLFHYRNCTNAFGGRNQCTAYMRESRIFNLFTTSLESTVQNVAMILDIPV